MRIALLASSFFMAGMTAGIAACWYASPVWSYNEAIGIREGLVDASVREFRKGRYAEAASTMREANRVATRADIAWPFFFPWNASVVRITGVFSQIHVGPAYRAPETAFLYRAAGDEANAGPFYRLVQERTGRTQEQIDASSASFLRESAAFQEKEEGGR
jgi:hypothetical protein